MLDLSSQTTPPQTPEKPFSVLGRGRTFSASANRSHRNIVSRHSVNYISEFFATLPPVIQKSDMMVSTTFSLGWLGGKPSDFRWLWPSRLICQPHLTFAALSHRSCSDSNRMCGFCLNYLWWCTSSAIAHSLYRNVQAAFNSTCAKPKRPVKGL